MKKLIFTVFLSTMLYAQSMSVRTQGDSNSGFSEGGQCKVFINDILIYQRRCDYEFEPELLLFTKFIKDGKEELVWVFQDNQNYAACSGKGKIRIIAKRADEENPKYCGEIDWCQAQASFQVVEDTLYIREVPHTSMFLPNGEINFKNEGKLIGGAMYRFQNGEISKVKEGKYK